MDTHINASTLVLAGGIIAILLRKRAIGGWLFYFFWQVLLGLALIVTTTRWSQYRSSEWSEGGAYFAYVVSNLPRILCLALAGLVWVIMVRSRDWQWVTALRYTLAVYAFLTLLKIAADQAYFPANRSVDALSLAFPLAWIVYFAVSVRVHAVFRDERWR